MDLGLSNYVFGFNCKLYQNKKEIIPKLREVSKFGIWDWSKRKAKFIYENSITSDISVSINQRFKNETEIFGSKGTIKILDPWLPKKKNIIEVKKDNKIEKITSNAELEVFANQINYFNLFVQNKNLKENYPAMSIDNSVNYMKVMTEWRDLVFKNESK